MKDDVKKIMPMDMFGKYCIKRKDGERLCDILLHSIRRLEKIEVNMAHVDLYTSDFIEGMVRALTENFSASKIYKFVQFTNTRETTKNSIEFAINFYFRYNNDDEYKHEIDTKYNTLLQKGENDETLQKINNIVGSLLSTCGSGYE